MSTKGIGWEKDVLRQRKPGGESTHMTLRPVMLCIIADDGWCVERKRVEWEVDSPSPQVVGVGGVFLPLPPAHAQGSSLHGPPRSIEFEEQGSGLCTCDLVCITWEGCGVEGSLHSIEVHGLGGCGLTGLGSTTVLSGYFFSSSIVFPKRGMSHA